MEITERRVKAFPRHNPATLFLDNEFLPCNSGIQEMYYDAGMKALVMAVTLEFCR